MRRISWAIALACSMACTMAAASAADATIEPGLYEIVTKTSPGSPQTERRCLTAADITKGLQASDLGKGCKSIRAVVAGGKIDFATTCPDMAMTSTGSYTATSYTIDGKVQIKGDDEPMTIESHIAGKKVGACTAK
jgi:hypothetical protein